MDFWSRMKQALDKGAATSRELFDKAKDKAQDLGEMGVLKIEISQLENQAEKLIAKLGARTFEVLVGDGQSTLSRKTSGVGELLDEIDSLRSRIADKEEALKYVQGKGREQNAGGEKESRP